MALLDVKNLDLSFAGLKVISDLTFSVEDGSIASLIGPNGAGKTSVFNCLTGFYKPTGGAILFDQKIITRKKPHKITQMGMARTFQNLRLFKSMTVLENVMSGMHCRSSAGPVSSILRTVSLSCDARPAGKRLLRSSLRFGKRFLPSQTCIQSFDNREAAFCVV
jgi:branched-chain amino acid transport system ATP-binding protein